MYKIYFKNVNNIIICECSSLYYSNKDGCIYLEYNGTNYRCSMNESEAINYLMDGIRNSYIYFNDKIFSIV